MAGLLVGLTRKSDQPAAAKGSTSRWIGWARPIQGSGRMQRTQSAKLGMKPRSSRTCCSPISRTGTTRPVEIVISGADRQKVGQVAAEIRRAIADGEASQGERLPPAVDLAAVLGVNKNTVIRALHILRDEGVLDFTRGRGIRVVGTPARSAIMNKVNELVTLAREQGYRKDELASMIVSVYQQGLS